MLAEIGGRAKVSESHQRWAVFMYSDLQCERSLASWNVFGSSRRWGLDRRPDLEWRLIARCHQSHKQPKLYLDAVGCPPGAVLAVQPQSIYVLRASPRSCMLTAFLSHSIHSISSTPIQHFVHSQHVHWRRVRRALSGIGFDHPLRPSFLP
jgi:hypothetical protein